jgi:integrase
MPDYKLDRIPNSPKWYIVWTEGRRSRRVSTRETDRQQAELVLAAFRLERNRKPEAHPDEIAVATVLNDYIERHASKLPSAVQASIARDHLCRFFGASRVSAVTPSSIDEYVVTRQRAKIKNDTINRELMVLRAALNRAHKHGWLRYVPHISTLPASPPRERFLEREEAARLLRACKPRHLRLFVRLALYTGARPGAILDLTWDRVDFRSRLIYYPLPARAGHNKRRAVVPFGGALYTALQRAKKKAKTKHVIEWDGAAVASVKTAWRKAVKDAGLAGVVRYTLRHTAATWAARTAPIYEVAKLLGNRASMAERYAKHQPDYLRAAVAGIMRGARKTRATEGA